MRSTGSGAELADDDGQDESAIKESDYERDKSLEKGKQPHLRRKRHWDREYDRREEDARKKEEEIRRMEREVRRKEEDVARKVQKAKKMEMVIMKKEADVRRKEKEARIKEQDAKRKEEAAKLEEEEARRKIKELSRKEEEAKKREEYLKKKEEAVHKKDIEMKERENILRQREEEMMRREVDNFCREEEAKRAKRDEAFVRQEEETDDDNDDSSSEDRIEAMRLRDLEAKNQKLEESLTQPAWRDWDAEGNRHSNYPRPISRQLWFTHQTHVDLNDDEKERERGRGRERHWVDREYDRDRDRDGGRDIIHSDPRRSTTYSASWHPSYSNSTPGGSSRPSAPPLPDYDFYEDWEGAPGSSHGYNRPPRDDPDRRFTVDNGSYLFFFSLTEEHAFC